MSVECSEYPVVSQNYTTQAAYVQMRRNGESHNMAEILALRTFCAVKSDAIFTEGWFSGSSGRNDAEQIWLRQQADAAGVNPAGKHYLRGLADFPGDPRAFVSDGSDVLRVAREKNMTVHGYVEHQADQRDLPEDSDKYRVADDIINREVDEIIAECPAEFASRREEIRDDVYRHRAGLVDNNPLVVDSSPQVIPGPNM